MLQARDNLPLFIKTLQQFGPAGVHHFQGYQFGELAILAPGSIDHPHAPRADAVDDFGLTIEALWR